MVGRNRPNPGAGPLQRAGPAHRTSASLAHREKLPKKTTRGPEAWFFLQKSGPRPSHGSDLRAALFAAWAAVAPADLDHEFGWGVLGPCLFSSAPRPTRPAAGGWALWSASKISGPGRRWTNLRLGGSKQQQAETDKRPGPLCWSTPTHKLGQPLPARLPEAA